MSCNIRFRCAQRSQKHLKGAYQAGVKTLNSMPPTLKTILDEKAFKIAFKRCLNTFIFYSVYEFMHFKKDFYFF
jgi:hypothetical protein